MTFGTEEGVAGSPADRVLTRHVHHANLHKPRQVVRIPHAAKALWGWEEARYSPDRLHLVTPDMSLLAGRAAVAAPLMRAPFASRLQWWWFRRGHCVREMLGDGKKGGVEDSVAVRRRSRAGCFVQVLRIRHFPPSVPY